MKYMIISQPKAGTYLCANLLQEFDLEFTYMHISKHRYRQYHPDKLIEGRKSGKQFNVDLSMDKSIPLIKDNQFAVSHLLYGKKYLPLFDDFKIILLLRDLETTVESLDYWFKRSNRQGIINPQKYISKEQREKIARWSKLKGDKVFVMDFYHMKNKNIEKLDKLQQFLFDTIKFDSETCITNAMKKDSLTKRDNL